MLRQLGLAAHLVATDINPRAALATLSTLAAHGQGGVDIVLTDLASALRPRLDGLVDLLVGGGLDGKSSGTPPPSANHISVQPRAGLQPALRAHP